MWDTPMPLQWRARIGCLCPGDGDKDAERWRFLPYGVTIHTTLSGAPQGELTVQKIEEMAESSNLEAAARLLIMVPLDAIAYFCTAASFIGGPGSDQKIVRRLQETTGVSATTTSTAAIQALKVLKIRRVAVVAPYPKPVTERLISFLEGNAVEVVNWDTMDLKLAEGFEMITPGDVYRLVRKTDHPNADGVFISCTGMPTRDIIEALEQDIGKPVLSATQVTIWHSLILAGVHCPMSGMGKLYTSFPRKTDLS